MQTHNLKRKHPNKKSKLVGRGGAHAKTAGRGTKGQNARAGHKKRPEIRDFIKRIPKLRGRGKNINTSVWDKKVAINLKEIETAYKAGEIVSPNTLVSKGLLHKVGDKFPKVKILGNEELKNKLTIKGCDISQGAKEAVEKAGGSVLI